VEPKDKESEAPSNVLGVALSAGTQFAVSVGVGAGGGYWLDDKLGSAPWLTLVGTAAGFALGLTQLVREVSRLQKPRRPSSDREAPR